MVPSCQPSLLKNKINRQHQKAETYQVVPFECLVFEEQGGEKGKHHQGNDFLQHFEFDQRKGTAVFAEADAVGGYLEKIFEQGNAPADEYNGHQAQIAEPLHFMEFEVAVPGKGHEDVGKNKQAYGVKSFHRTRLVERVVLLEKEKKAGCFKHFVGFSTYN